MRKAQKKQIEEIIALMAEAQAEIKNAIRKKNLSLALELLEQCQQGAIQVGTSIDALEGEGHPTVTLLEQYCELVYKLHEELANGSLKAGADAATYAGQLLEASWTRINKSVEEDIPARIEVVFCPYKASMWDSLESVWKAAAEDPNCDAYVIPIPYFDKKPNGAFAEEHYEGLEYPEYVPITYYKSYNFEERRPDIVFIHNPYDENNFVTTVHPFYYASNLVKYTDKLVYIPYFVLGEPDWENITEKGKEKMRMFCIQPGVLQSHKVIVQSEAMKQVYVNILCEEFGERHRPMWEDKILGIGSPKFDKVANSNEDAFVIPEEWKPVLYDADGCMRKVILYNTSVSALLEHRDKMLKKMRQVFRWFSERKEEMVLLWRPHPLTKATIESMLPKLWEEYTKLVEEYKQAGWGIYDDSAELNRALELADVYYGDRSSLVQLCQEKGMLVLMQDVEEEEFAFNNPKKKAEQIVANKVAFQHKVYPEIHNLVRVGEYLYGFAQEDNALLRIDLVSGQVAFMGSLPNQTEKKWLIGNIAVYGEYIIISPLKAQQVYVYDIKKNTFLQAKEAGEVNRKQAEQTLEIIIDNGVVYFLPYRGRDVIRLNVKDLSITRSDALYKIYQKQCGEAKETFWMRGFYHYEEANFSIISGTKYIMEYSFEPEKCCIHQVEENVLFMYGYKEYLYLLTENKKVIQWNITNKQTAHVRETGMTEEEYPRRLQDAAVIGGNLYFLGRGTMLVGDKKDFGVKIDTTQEQVSTFSFEEKFGIKAEGGEHYSFSTTDEKGNMYFLSTYFNLQIYSMYTREVRKLSIKPGAEVKRKNINSRNESQNSIGKHCWLAAQED